MYRRAVMDVLGTYKSEIAAFGF